MNVRCFLSLVIALLLVLSGAAAKCAPESGAPSAMPRRAYGIAPLVLYQKAWRLVKQTYYDQRFNGQDWKSWEHRYDGKLETLEDAHKAIATMLSSLGDPDTRLMERDNADWGKQQVLFGVGLRLTQLRRDSGERQGRRHPDIVFSH
jgi:C-terminal processing protease CtpA/Prc